MADPADTGTSAVPRGINPRLPGFAVHEHDFTVHEMRVANLLAKRFNADNWDDGRALSREQKLLWLQHARHLLAHLRDM